MQLTIILAVATALCATSASARTCFETGEHWGDHQEAKVQLASACGDLKGTYVPFHTTKVCRNSRYEEKSFVFGVENEKDYNVGVTQAQCEQTIGDIIDNCGHGGKESVGGTIQRYVIHGTA